MRSSWCPGTDPAPINGLRFAIKLLRRDGWPIARIAKYLDCNLSEVRRALDPKAQEAHERWER